MRGVRRVWSCWAVDYCRSCSVFKINCHILCCRSHSKKFNIFRDPAAEIEGTGTVRCVRWTGIFCVPMNFDVCVCVRHPSTQSFIGNSACERSVSHAAQTDQTGKLKKKKKRKSIRRSQHETCQLCVRNYTSLAWQWHRRRRITHFKWFGQMNRPQSTFSLSHACSAAFKWARLLIERRQQSADYISSRSRWFVHWKQNECVFLARKQCDM